MTIFWRNKVITPLAKFLILATGFLGAAHLLLTILGRYRTEFGLIDTNSIFSLRKSSNFCEPPVILNGSFSPSPCGSQLLCAPSYKASQEGFITCAWFFGPQGVVEISLLYCHEHHHVITLRSYSTLACVPNSQGQAIPALPTNSSTISVQGGDISEQRDGNREMRFFDHMERRARFMMDEEESRQVNVPACDESLLEEHVNP